jgi:hypothetical protein
LPPAARALARSTRVCTRLRLLTCTAARTRLTRPVKFTPATGDPRPGAKLVPASSSGIWARPIVHVPRHGPCTLVPCLLPSRFHPCCTGLLLSRVAPACSRNTALVVQQCHAGLDNSSAPFEFPGKRAVGRPCTPCGQRIGFTYQVKRARLCCSEGELSLSPSGLLGVSHVRRALDNVYMRNECPILAL